MLDFDYSNDKSEYKSTYTPSKSLKRAGKSLLPAG
jgi:hypothetical protein